MVSSLVAPDREAMEKALQVIRRNDGTATVIDCTGEIDIFTAPLLKEAGQIIDDRMVIDLTQVEFIDANGIGTILGIYNRMLETYGETAKLSVVIPRGTIINKLFVNVLSLDKVIPIHFDLQSALLN